MLADWTLIRWDLWRHASGDELRYIDGDWHAFNAAGHELYAVCVGSSRLPMNAHLAVMPSKPAREQKPLGRMDRSVHLLPGDPDDADELIRY